MLVSIAADTTASSDPPRTVPVRDSAGIRIVEYPSLAVLKLALILDERPLREMGADATGVMFSKQQPFLAPAWFSDGRMAVSDLADVKLFSGDGHFFGSFGGFGSGRDKFQHIRKICVVAGDTLLAFEYSKNQVSRWSSSGAFLGATSLSASPSNEPCFRDGKLLLLGLPTSSKTVHSSGPPKLIEYAEVELSGKVLRLLGSVPADEYGPVTREAIVGVAGEQVYAGDGMRFEIRFQARDGRLRRILRIMQAPEQISANLWLHLVKQSIPKDVTGSARDSVIARSLGLPHPRALPAYRDVKVDATGRLWVQDYRDIARWYVFAADGRPYGYLHLRQGPTNSRRLVAIRGDTLILQLREPGRPMRLGFFRFRRVGDSSR